MELVSFTQISQFRDSTLLTASLKNIGRTTFVNTLCGKKVLEHKDADDAANAHIEEGVRIKPVTVGTLKFGYIADKYQRLTNCFNNHQNWNSMRKELVSR